MTNPETIRTTQMSTCNSSDSSTQQTREPPMDQVNQITVVVGITSATLVILIVALVVYCLLRLVGTLRWQMGNQSVDDIEIAANCPVSQGAINRTSAGNISFYEIIGEYNTSDNVDDLPNSLQTDASRPIDVSHQGDVTRRVDDISNQVDDTFLPVNDISLQIDNISCQVDSSSSPKVDTSSASLCSFRGDCDGLEAICDDTLESRISFTFSDAIHHASFLRAFSSDS